MNRKAPLISIITVVFNSRDLLEKTIRSIISQKYKNIEYIVIDGGSTDGTIEIIRKYESNIKQWISEKDAGIYDAMNKGLSKANGEYVWFINSGDEIADQEVIEKIFNTDDNVDCYYGSSLLVYRDGSIEKETRIPSQLTWRTMLDGMVVSHQAIIFRRRCVGLYDLKYRLVSDHDWIIRGLKTSKVIKRINIPFTKYLLGGISDKRFNACWKERFIITASHYGKQTIVYSILLYIIAVLKRLRKNILYKLYKPSK